MQEAALILSILGCIFGILGFIAAAVTSVIVLGWRASTHKIEYVKPEETRWEVDAPQEVVDQLPSSPEPVSLGKWMQDQRSRVDELYDQDLGA
jgi:hypothetical protein